MTSLDFDTASLFGIAHIPPQPVSLVSSGTIQAAGVDLHFVTAGKGTPLVLIHGFPQTWYQWRRLIGPLADGFTVIAPDLRGIGATPGPATGYDKQSLAADIRAIVEHVCGDTPALVVGHDMGSFVAFAYALRSRSQSLPAGKADIATGHRLTNPAIAAGLPCRQARGLIRLGGYPTGRQRRPFLAMRFTDMLEGKHFQNAYITRDIEKALDTFRTRLNAPQDIRCFEVTVDVKTPAGSGAATNKLAFIWIDNLQYELIQPVSGLVDVYSDQLPVDDSLKFHHICMRVNDWDRFRSEVDRKGYSVVLEGGGDALKYVYLDARDTLGHYLEYVWMTPERWTQLGGR